ncbi:LuxR family transcriptional regulator [Yoonia sediminilitoris]|uniref:LuxR family transcriptional regulator n=1 Tax=Yoonia sediminilitoris TaxID=1286148 RepID=A0A2T6KD21_9RHOB|nr:LuxR family transcriptional regulator [Yoonia sediminilitoris]PUB12830.1 LuxR family transcriptional regulator [Yoonia sediminilitoris]RCW94309.1 LuxR family transcriptional regulator [Yoonia sediminilitoris]
MSDLIAHLEGLTNAGSVEELWNIHTNKMREYGFDRVMYGYTRYRTSNSLGDPQDWVLLSNQTPEYMQVFFDEGLYYNAPMIRWALANDGACAWRWMVEVDNLTDEEKRVIAFNQKMGVTAGYTISFRSISERTKAATALTARPGLDQAAVDKTWEEHGDAIVVMNNVMHLKLLTLPYTGDRHLTKRQREVLQWVGDGKTTQDTAILLGLTPATVEKHLRLAREALDVETTAQAVLKAAFYNQMFVIDGDTDT